MVSHEQWMQIATNYAQNSKAKRLRVGCVLVNPNNQIQSLGYNKMPYGLSEICEDENNITKSEVLHAEEVCLLQCNLFGQNTNNSSLYVNFSPCLKCASKIYLAGISNVYYNNLYRDTSGLDYLAQNGINAEQINLK